nr:MAG TPA: hypothetical protein [Caudoviricetes sp.]
MNLFSYVSYLLMVCCCIVNSYMGICCIYTFCILLIHISHTPQTFSIHLYIKKGGYFYPPSCLF